MKGLAEARAEARELLRKKDGRTPWQLLSIVNGIFWPVLLFVYIYNLSSGTLRMYKPMVACALGLPGLVACAAVTVQTRTKLLAAEAARSLLCLTVCLWAALVMGLILGDRNFHWYMTSYYGFQDLAVYTDLDPSVDKGQSYMDAGQIYFKEGVEIDTQDMITFRSGNVYCAAPILGQPLWNQDDKAQLEQSGALRLPKSGTLDFWAVGVDCCDKESKTFTCGAAGSRKARAGIRLLRDDIRPFYRMAVEQWEAQMCPLDDNTLKSQAKSAPHICPHARHPIFLHWVVDPLLEVDTYVLKSEQAFHQHLLLFTMGNTGFLLFFLWFLFFLGLK